MKTRQILRKVDVLLKEAMPKGRSISKRRFTGLPPGWENVEKRVRFVYLRSI
jgi:hypothetical protein